VGAAIAPTVVGERRAPPSDGRLGQLGAVDPHPPMRGVSMGARGTSFAKLDRERSKKAKAAAKRERRVERDDEDILLDELPAGDGELAPDELLRMVEQVQRRFDAEEIDFEEYEERKSAILARIKVD
jgi:hypothetical protein